MLKILYRTAFYSYHVDDTKKYKAGMIATFCESSAAEKVRPFVEVCDDKRRPIGFFCEGSEKRWDTWEYPGTVAVGQGEYSTDIFEPDNYNLNDLLYCSPNGKITSNFEKSGKIAVGIVNSVSEEQIGFITVFDYTRK